MGAVLYTTKLWNVQRFWKNWSELKWSFYHFPTDWGHVRAVRVLHQLNVWPWQKASITLIVSAVMDKLSITPTVSRTEREDNMVIHSISIIVCEQVTFNLGSTWHTQWFASVLGQQLLFNHITKTYSHSITSYSPTDIQSERSKWILLLDYQLFTHTYISL